jgi:hypothetical protein
MTLAYTSIQPTFSPARANSPHPLVPIATLQINIFENKHKILRAMCEKSMASIQCPELDTRIDTYANTESAKSMTPNDSSLATLFIVI